MSLRLRWLAGQFARPRGWVGGRLIALWLDRISARANGIALAALDPRPGESILEIGFGGGALLAALLEAGASPLGADVSRAMTARARRRLGSHARIVDAPAEALPFISAAIDKAVSVNSLYFWRDLAGALSEIARVLRPAGRLVLVWESPQTLRKWPGHVYGFSVVGAPEAAAAAAGAGFSDVRIEAEAGFLCLTAERCGAESP